MLHDAIMSTMTTEFLMRLFSLVAANQGEPGEPVSGLLCWLCVDAHYAFLSWQKGSPRANRTGWHSRTRRTTRRAGWSRYSRTTSKRHFDFDVCRLISCFIGTGRTSGRARWNRTDWRTRKFPFIDDKVSRLIRATFTGTEGWRRWKRRPWLHDNTEQRSIPDRHHRGATRATG